MIVVGIFVILGIVIFCCFITLWVGISNDVSIYEIFNGMESNKTKRAFDNLFERVGKLEKESDRQKAEIKKIKGQFIWSEESEEEE